MRLQRVRFSHAIRGTEIFMTEPSKSDPDDRLEWIEPEIVALNIQETTMRPGRGRDGGRFADCTRS